jgi:hypothetical protein
MWALRIQHISWENTIYPTTIGNVENYLPCLKINLEVSTVHKGQSINRCRFLPGMVSFRALCNEIAGRVRKVTRPIPEEHKPLSIPKQEEVNMFRLNIHL